MNEKIGNDAGRVWSVLNENGTKTIKELKKVTKLSEKEIYAAIGWLAREEKLIFDQKEDDKDIYLSLIK
ncbi:MAG: winged helix-turn-helix domain-containing protein [Candidatus Azobacteroides sp.]|nr:winged helix-turn-helix domain-containing protein [Candidatus Azobacteroides sp.]